MTKTRRILSFGQGIFLLVFALMLFVFPEGALPVIAGLYGIGMTLRGFGTLLYYFRMARFMVGGKRVLYTGLIFLDFGIFTAALARRQDQYIIFYIAAITAFYGLVGILRARESRMMGSGRWIGGLLYGVIMILSAFAVVIAAFLFHQSALAVWVYAAGLVYSAGEKIYNACRRTAILYIP